MSAAVIVGLSGGVDSSVAALTLQQQGYQPAALFMKNWHEPAAAGACSWENDVEDALRVCERLNIPLNTVDLSDAYWRKVFAGFLRDYAAGLTPNPDILCNQEIKFRAFLEHALAAGAGRIATGHYVRIRQDEAGLHLLKGSDAAKDQSYFLCRLDQGQLQHSLFPIGHITKTEVRRRARQAALITHAKRDSAGICFIGRRPFRAFLRNYLPIKKGLIISTDGLTLGEHDGVHFYTLGQRQGLGLGGVAGRAQAPWYVAEKDIEQNILIVVQGHDHPRLFSCELYSDTMRWVCRPPAREELRCTARIRHGQTEQPCRVRLLSEQRIQLRFDKAQRAVTPGQYVALYQGQECLGGGIIAAGRSGAVAVA